MNDSAAIDLFAPSEREAYYPPSNADVGEFHTRFMVWTQGKRKEKKKEQQRKEKEWLLSPDASAENIGKYTQIQKHKNALNSSC